MDTLKEFSWVKEIDYLKHLDDDSKLIVEEFGLETYLKLFSIFSKTRVYFNNKFLYRCKKEFIRSNIEKYSIRQFCWILDLSQDCVRKYISDAN
jgi:hypothetical protein